MQEAGDEPHGGDAQSSIDSVLINNGVDQVGRARREVTEVLRRIDLQRHPQPVRDRRVQAKFAGQGCQGRQTFVSIRVSPHTTSTNARVGRSLASSVVTRPTAGVRERRSRASGSVHPIRLTSRGGRTSEGRRRHHEDDERGRAKLKTKPEQSALRRLRVKYHKVTIHNQSCPF